MNAITTNDLGWDFYFIQQLRYHRRTIVTNESVAWNGFLMISVKNCAGENTHLILCRAH